MNPPGNHSISELVDHLFREEAGKMTAVLTRIFGFEHAETVEDIIQDTFITALKTWSFKGTPDSPSAWLMQVAKNKTINAIKRDKRFMPAASLEEILNNAPEEANEVMDTFFLEHELKDSQLRILFACCQPSILLKNRIALTLKTLSGFSNAEIARALLMSEPAVKKMIYRARKSIHREETSFDVPFIYESEERLDAVRTVCYLMFNEGYKRSEGDRLIKESLCREAMRLTHLLTDMDIGVAESAALLALMLFNAARFPARIDKDGNAVDLSRQDRNLWNNDLIQRGFYFLSEARKAGVVSRYHLEAGISSVHCIAQKYEETDWAQIVAYYQRLAKMAESPVIKLNYAIALSNHEGPEAGLHALEDSGLQEPLEQYYLLYAAKADIYYRLQQYGRAKVYYQLALDLTEAESDKHFLLTKIKDCDLKSISNS